MKEITNVLTVKITTITKNEDEAVERWLQDNQDPEQHRLFEKKLESLFGCDKVNIVEVQDFVMDVKAGGENEFADN